MVNYKNSIGYFFLKSTIANFRFIILRSFAISKATSTIHTKRGDCAMKKTILGLFTIAFILLTTSAAYSGVGPGMKLRENIGKMGTVMEEMHKKMCEGQLTPEAQKEMCGMMKDMCGMMQEMKTNPDDPTLNKCSENLNKCMMRMKDMK
jgi:hypothetical protein